MTATSTGSDNPLGFTLVFALLTVMAALAATGISMQAALAGHAETGGAQLLTGIAMAAALIFGGISVGALHTWE
jgi:hypothetical protein